MRRTTTLIATVGGDFDEVVEEAAEAAGNVAVEPVPRAVESLPEWAQQLRQAWTAAQRRSAIYTLVSADPLSPVVREWERRLDGLPYDLELAIGLMSDALVPDFYFIDPLIGGASSHWYLDHLARLAPTRVILTEPTVRSVLAGLRALPYGQRLPEAAHLAASARSYVPLPQIETPSALHDRTLVR